MKIYLAMLLLILSGGDNDIKGRWESLSAKGNITGVIFKDDNTFEGYVNKKSFTTGMYTYKGDTIDIVDNGCEGRHGIYKVQFYHNGDSMKWIPILDSCDNRRNGVLQLRLGRTKKSAQ